MKIAICDDEEILRTRISDEIQSNKVFSESVTLHEFSTGEELVEQYENGFRADIVFMDIQMEKLTGVESARRIRLLDDKAIFIFVSSYYEEVFKTFELGVFHFLVKPFTSSDFQKALDRAVDKYKRDNAYILVTYKNETARVSISEIKYVERITRNINFTTEDKVYKSSASLSEVFEKLQPYGFIKSHQGCIVNMNKIKTFEGSDLVLEDGTKVMMSVRRRTDVIKTFTKYIKG